MKSKLDYFVCLALFDRIKTPFYNKYCEYIKIEFNDCLISKCRFFIIHLEIFFISLTGLQGKIHTYKNYGTIV